MPQSKSTARAPAWFSSSVLAVFGALWILLLGAGFTLLAREEFTPVAGTTSPSAFPTNSALHTTPGRETLIVFAHPQCPCTRATLRELDQLLSAVHDKVAVVVVFTIPRGVPPGWERGDLWDTATRMLGVTVFRDQDGHEARRFNVRGSGHVLLYGPKGNLLFSGGITPSRGHDGDSPGRTAVTEFVLEGHALVDHTPVFGCSLL